MTVLASERRSPSFTLRDLSGTERTLGAFLRPAGTLLVFFKTECATCRLSLPFVEILHRAYAEDLVSALAVSENTIEEARAFAAEVGLKLPVLCQRPPYPVSSAFGVCATPTFFLLSGDGRIVGSQPGFRKDFFLELRDRWREATGRAEVDPFGGAQVPAVAPG